MPVRGVTAEWPKARSRKAPWALRFGSLALAVLLVATLAFRNWMISLNELFAAFGLGTALGAIGLGLSIGALIDLWRRGGSGVRLALFGFVASALAAAPATFAGFLNFTLPALNDVTTNPDSPPILTPLRKERESSGASIDYPGPAAAAAQAEAYPELAPLTVPQPPETAFDAVRTLVKERGWREVLASPPTRGAGLIVAAATTFAFKFEDDVAIRVSAAQLGSRIDMRSASRIGKHDLGTNANRISDFLAELEQNLNNPGQ